MIFSKKWTLIFILVFNFSSYLKASEETLEAEFEDSLSKLHLLAEAGNVRALEALLKQEEDPNQTALDGVTALHLAAHEGHKKVVKLLLAYRADPNCKTKEGVLPLHIAATENHEGIAELLLKANSGCVNTQTKEGKTALYFAASYCHLGVVDVLFKYRADPRIGKEKGFSPLKVAKDCGHENLWKRLVKKAFWGRQA